MFPRIAWSVVLGVAALHIAGFYFYGHERMLANARTFAMAAAERALQLDSLLTQQPELLPLVQNTTFRIERLQTPPPPSQREGWPHNKEIVQAVLQHLQARGLADTAEVQVAYVTRPGPPQLRLLIPSQAGGYLQIFAQTHVTRWVDRSGAGLSMTLFLVAVVALILFVTRRLTRQLGRFSSAAERLGQGQAGAPLPERVGPRELRRASIAFNRMQSRVMALLDERSNMLAGVSHDLRTLCTRLGLRLEYISNPEQQAKAQQDIHLMTDILDQALTFARDEHSEEVFEALDLSSLLQSLAHNLQDQGFEVTFAGPEPLIVTAQPLAVTRLFENLVDNALKYGGAARIEWSAQQVRVVDPGEGFSPAQQADALAPYMRLESARSQDLPGTGLGLAIADNVCRRHGWRLSFQQLHPGFAARVQFRV